MIDVIKQTPKIYSEMSRDYQIISRLQSSLYNVSKMYIDNMSIWNPDIDDKLAYLRAKTLNFDPKHSWSLKDVESITSYFKYLVKRKGAKIALEYVLNILMKVHNLRNSNSKVELVTIENNNVIIRVEENLATVGIVEDLIKYILPAGLTYRIIEYKSMSMGSDRPTTEVTVSNGDTSTSTIPGEKEDITIGSDREFTTTFITSENK